MGGGKESVSKYSDVGKTQPLLTALKREEGGHKLRNVNHLQKLRKARKWIHNWRLQKGTQLQ